MATMKDESSVREQVREGYSKIATEGVWVSAGQAEAQPTSGCCGGGGCCGGVDAEAVARTVGYDEAELATLPEGANMGLSCGNPTAIAGLRAGEVLLDLGSGGAGLTASWRGRRSAHPAG